MVASSPGRLACFGKIGRVSSNRRWAASPGTWAVRVLVIVFAALAMVLLAGMFVLSAGMVHGQEFSPQLLTIRGYVYWRVPGTGWQLLPATRTTLTNNLLVHMRTRGYVAVDRQNVRWDAIESSLRPDEFDRGDAAIALAYLEAQDRDGDLYWLVWSKQHAAHAAVLWPAFIDLCRNKLYLAVPDLLELAESAPPSRSADQFQQRVDQWLAQTYADYADLFEQAGQAGRAASYIRRAEALQAPADASPTSDDL